MRKLLLLMLLVVSSIGVWAQGPYYKFTSDAVDNLYTDQSGTKLTFNVGDLCTSNYFVLEDKYTLATPSTQTEKVFKVKNYYAINGGVYTLAWNLAYNSSKQYATVSATKLNLTSGNVDYTNYINELPKNVFNSSCAYICEVEILDDETVISEINKDYGLDKVKLTLVTEGTVFDENKMYVKSYNNTTQSYVNEILYNPNNRSNVSSISYALTSSTVKIFKEAALGIVYTENNEIYTPISSTSYTEGTEYYTLSYTEIPLSENETIFKDEENIIFESSDVVILGSDVLYYKNNEDEYTLVEDGSMYLGAGKYYTKSLDYVSKTPAQLATLNYVNSVDGYIKKEPSTDGKTLTLICTGDVCNPGDAYETNGYKFQNLTPNTLFFDQKGTAVANGDTYYNKDYYSREIKYESATATIKKNTVDIYTFNGDVELYKGCDQYGNFITTDVHHYILSTDAVWDKKENAGASNYFTRAEAGTYSAITDFSAYAKQETVFNDEVENVLFIKDNNDGTYARVLENDMATEGPNYYKLEDSKKVTEWGDLLNTETNKFQGNPYHVKVKGDVITKVYAGDDYDSEAFYYPANEQTQVYNKTGYTTQKEMFFTTVYANDEGTEEIIAGTIKENGKTYYTKDYTYTNVTAEAIKSDSYTTYTNSTLVSTEGQTYYKGDGKTPVVDNEPFENGVEYYKANGYTYPVKPKAEYEDKLASATIATNYWEALANEINANGYETVVFKTADGEPKATICNHVTHAMMKTTTVNALDFLDVQIDKLVGSVEFGSSGDAIANGTFVNDDDNYKDNNNVTILLLPEIKNANSVGHKHVPTNLAVRFPYLQLIVMPNNATCVEHDAFSNKATINQVILNDGLKMIGHDAFSVSRLNVLTIPESVEYIGNAAFGTNAGGGYLHDVYFLGKKAPIVEMDAFGSKCYTDNNSYNRATPTGDNRFEPVNWRKDRSNYVNGDYMMAMLHLRTDLSEAERAAYTDVSRDFHVFDLKLMKDGNYVTIEEESPLKNPDDALVKEITADSGDKFTSIYWNGEENNSTITSKGTGVELTTNNLFQLERYDDHQSWENVTGFYDKVVGHQYRWPSQAGYGRSYAVATNNLLWDGKTTIAGGITGHGGAYTASSYDSNCDGTIDRTFENGNEYIGLHQFVLVTGDVSPNTTPQEWEFHTIGGKNWWTICVPVDMTVAEVREAFGEDTQVCKFHEVTRDKSDKVKFFFTDEQCYNKTATDKAILANYPYMIHPSNMKGDGTNGTSKFVLPRYELSGRQIPIEVEKSTTDVTDGKVYKYKFIGQYNTNADGSHLYMPKYSYFLGNAGDNVHKFYFQTGTNGTWKPFTCVIIPDNGEADYIDFFGGSTTGGAKVRAVSSMFGLDDYDETTSIKDYEIVCGAENDPANAKVYNLNGQMVGKSIDTLSRGIYIVNGKKYIVK